MSFSINIKKNLPSFGYKKLLKAADVGGFAAAKFVESDAKRRAPKDQGQLVNSIRAEKKSFGVYSVGSNLAYAPYPEYGTGKYAEGGGGRSTPWTYFSERFGFVTTEGQKSQPYMRPALYNNITKITNIISSYIGRVL